MEIQHNQIYNEDCLQFMKQLPDNYFDLIITDPPYGITKAEWDIVPSKKVFDEMFRVSKNQIIFGGHYMNLPTKDGWIIWNKLPFLKTTNQAELIWTSFLKKNIIIEFRFAGNCVGSKKPDYNRKKVIYTSEKPLEIAEVILSKFAKKGDLIFDPFAGSGSFLVACKQKGFKFVGCEINKDYVEICKRRLVQLSVADFTSATPTFVSQKEFNMGDKVTPTASPKDALHPSHHPNIMCPFAFGSQINKFTPSV